MTTDTSGLQFSLLGPVRAWLGEDEIDLGSRQQRALLAVLLLRLGEPVTVDEAARALWDDGGPRAASGTIRTYVYQLRRKIETIGVRGLSLRSHCGGYLLTADGAVIDTHRFDQRLRDARGGRDANDHARVLEQLRAALALWHGTPIAGAYSAYFDAERARLEQLYLNAAEELALAEIAAGEHTSAVLTLKTALTANPLGETLWELLLEALSRLGRRAEALAAYQQAREVLLTELGLEPGPRLRELHRRILVPEPVAVARRIRSSLPAQASLTPNGFIGRHAELKEITSLLPDSGDVTPITVVGAAGAGKTALAVRAAHEVRPHFPDGQLFASLTGLDGAPVAPEVVLAGLLTRCGLPAERLPRSLPALTSLWWSAVDGKRVVIVLDDAWDDSQVLPLLPNCPGAAVIVTSRRPLSDLPGRRQIPLGGLTLPDALQMLGSVIGNDRLHQDVGASARLVEACDYQPHAVLTAAAGLAARPQCPLDDLAPQIRARHHRTALIGA